MADRIKDERLQALFDAGIDVYSISKTNTIENCLYEAFLTYIKHERGKNGVYGILGTKIHDKLEQIMNSEATKDDLLPTLNEELSDLDMLGIDFPKDFKGGTSIRDGWVADMEHFCTNFTQPKGKFKTEELIIYNLDDFYDEKLAQKEEQKKARYIQGYIDLIRENDDGTISIYDWKTSSQFSENDLIHHGRQLVLYAISKEAEGFKIKQTAWIMLKYVEVTFMGKARVNSKEETKITKVLNRGKIIKELQKHLEYDLSKMGFNELDIEIMIDEAKKQNSFDVFPKEISSKYKIKPYVREYEITEELKKETIEYINSMADLFESLTVEDESCWTPRNFTKTNNKGSESEDTFFCNVLCNHRDTCKHIKKFNDLKALSKSIEEDLF